MLSSSRLVLKAQCMMLDVEDLTGYVSEGEQYRRSRFSHSSKYQDNVRVSANDSLRPTGRRKDLAHQCPQSRSKDKPLKIRLNRPRYGNKNDACNDPASESEMSDVEKSRSVYVSNVQRKGSGKQNSIKRKETRLYDQGKLIKQSSLFSYVPFT